MTSCGDRPRAPRALSATPRRRASSIEPKWAATSAPIAAVPSRPAIRATALLVAEAIPARRCSAPASTVVVSGATVSDSPSANTSTDGRSSEK